LSFYRAYAGKFDKTVDFRREANGFPYLCNACSVIISQGAE